MKNERKTKCFRSSISLFVASAGSLDAETKISMLRLFSDSIDLSDSESDGWTVHEWLKRTFARQRVPASQNSAVKLMQATAKEQYVEFNSRVAWSGQQHAVRAVICHQRHSRILQRMLGLSTLDREAIGQRNLEALGSMMALRVAGRAILPMVKAAGGFLRIQGFAWLQDGMTHRKYLQALSEIYTAWFHMLLDCVERFEEYTHLELEHYVR
ncbi:hypothetical protein NX059_001631 [Plenodomus lindquistii]|nr:hypothetical protein NX059_001631 [Plenodomus lindquistii]